MDLRLLRAHDPSHAEMSGFCEKICVVSFLVMSEVLVSQAASQADCLLHVHCIGTIARDIAQGWYPDGAMKPGPLCCRQRLSCKPGGKHVGMSLHISHDLYPARALSNWERPILAPQWSVHACYSAYARMGTEDGSGCLPSFIEACPGRGAHARCSVYMPVGPLLRRTGLGAGRGGGRRSMVRLRLRLYVGDIALSRRCGRALRRMLPTTTRGSAQCLHMYH